MARLEELTKGAIVRGVVGDRRVRVVDVAWHGSSAVMLAYTDEATGRSNSGGLRKIRAGVDEFRGGRASAAAAW